ncbi:restriction endonuclease subunit S [Anoxybacillus flavithermus]|uniref:Restriction endonuclease subunit S n=1 Tax=Anoxybacillus flavithermus TaxID=33934 RepID=A0AAX1ZYV8_9BACL|nr:restriction endonuclease subunit S [Anoxybacillus flavithermus]RWU12621.1 restriction endonuclease subunit S [Anoxybacillus flavithermus]
MSDSIQVLSIGEVVEKIIGGGTPSREVKEYYKGNIPWFTVKDLTYHRLSKSQEYITESALENSSTNLIPRGNVIVATRIALGRAFINEVDAAINQDLKALIPNKRKITAEYLLYSILHKSNIIEKMGTGTTVKGIRLEQLKSLLIHVPPIKEQKKIASILSTVDRAIEKTEAIIEQTEKVKKGLMQQLLTKGIGHTKFKKTEIGEIPEEWEVVKINDIFERVTRNNDFKDNYPVLTISAKEGFVDQKERFNRVIAGKSLEKYVLLHKGEFAYNRGNSKSYPFGVTYKLNDFEKGLVPFVYFSFRKRNNIECNLDFYQYYFLSHKLDRQLRKIITSSARQDGLMNISADEFFNLLIPFPPKSEQEEIAKYIESVGKRIKRERKKFELLNLVKKALMQVLLTGKVRVKVEDEVMSQ